MRHGAKIGVVGAALAFAANVEALTLEEALSRAEEIAPAVALAQAQVGVASAERKEANALLWNNPVVSGDLSRRRFPQPGIGESVAGEWGVGLAQTFETGGQAGHRRSAAQANFDAQRYGVADTRRRLRAEVTQRFFRALALQRRLGVEQESQSIAEEAAGLAGKRVAAGEDSRLDGNLARIEAERARNQAAAAREALTLARTELATLLQLPLASVSEVEGELSARRDFDRDALFAALAKRPDLLGLERRAQATRQRVDLERAARSPDVTLGLSGGREGPADARESFTMLSISVPLPLYRRNDAGVARAIAERTQAETEYRAALNGAQAELAGLLDRYRTLEERTQRLVTEVLPALDENLRLSRRARQAGEIAVPQLLLVTRQAIDARRELLDAQLEQRLVATAIEAATTIVQAQP